MKRLILAILTILCFVASASASLYDRGNGLIYDDVLDITWLQDANYAMTFGYDDDGRMNWDDAMNWVEQLEYKGFTDWRLPDAYNQDGSGPNTGQYVPDSEIGHVYFIDLNNSVGQPISNSGPFLGLDSPTTFWYGTEETASIAYAFRTSDGDTMTASKDTTLRPWAVHDGDIAAVPIPSAIWLLGSGLIGFIGVRRKLRK